MILIEAYQIFLLAVDSKVTHLTTRPVIFLGVAVIVPNPEVTIVKIPSDFNVYF
jgi:hypothetical protein